jgi:hypothetical protein
MDVTFNVLQREKGERYACGKNGAYDSWELWDPSKDELTALHTLYGPVWNSTKFDNTDTYKAEVPVNVRLSNAAVTFIILHDLSAAICANYYPLDFNTSEILHRTRPNLRREEYIQKTHALSFQKYVLMGGRPNTQFKEGQVREIIRPVAGKPDIPTN